ncbi:TfuA-like protein [Roseiarcus sp.]|uniref:TfuA-like protein n=1 Tax=Roseiarcus sp. TaxID=1969460 RepID=UPI003F9D3E72
MKIIVFVGPTLPAEDIAACGDIAWLPPVAQGDVYRAAQRRQRAIGIIDGYFSGAPSVWHKEILWAISQDIPVFGSASMGALRAAELHTFGMRGIGRIFEAFRDGELEDDDEVAVVHGPAELGHVQASEAMVNIRATLARAAKEGVLSKSSRDALEAFGKSMFFPQRCWDALLEGAATLGVAEPERAALSAWLPGGRVDQKRADALEMLAAMREAPHESNGTPPKFNFEWTHFWDEFMRRFEAGHENPGASTRQPVVEELRLEGPEAYARVEAMALLRRVAVTGAAPMALPPAAKSLRATLTDIRTRLGLFTRADLDCWMARNDLDAVSMERLVADEAGLAVLRDLSSGALEPFLIDELRLTGAFERLAERAREKSDVLAARFAGSAGAPSGSQALALRLWYFERRLGRPPPDDVEDFARRLGFADAADFDAALLRERLYLDEQRGDKTP